MSDNNFMFAHLYRSHKRTQMMLQRYNKFLTYANLDVIFNHFLTAALLHRISKSPTYLTRTSLSSGNFLRRSLFPVYIFPATLSPPKHITSSIYTHTLIYHTRAQRRKIEGRMDELDTIKIIASYF